MVYEVIVIGAGPAGANVAYYLARRGLKVMVIAREPGNPEVIGFEVENPNAPSELPGSRLMSIFRLQLEKARVDYLAEEVANLSPADEDFRLYLTNDRYYEANAVVIATGMHARHLGVPGEDRLHKHGLSYCTASHAPMLLGQDVVVVGHAQPALEAAVGLSRLARQVTLVSEKAWEGPPAIIGKLRAASNLTFYENSVVNEIHGERAVEGITFTSSLSGDVKQLDTRGIFIELGREPNSGFASRLLALNEKGEIRVNARSVTTAPGVFAAGDVTDVFAKQLIIAAGEGAKASFSVYEYLLRQR